MEEMQDAGFDSKHQNVSGKLESVSVAEHTDFGEARRREATVVAYVLEAGEEPVDCSWTLCSGPA